MAASIRNNCARTARAVVLVAQLAFGASASAAEVVRAGEDFTWSADVLNSDFRSDTLDLSGQRQRDAGADVDRSWRGDATRLPHREQPLAVPEVGAHPHRRSGAAIQHGERSDRRRADRACARRQHRAEHSASELLSSRREHEWLLTARQRLRCRRISASYNCSATSSCGRRMRSRDAFLRADAMAIDTQTNVAYSTCLAGARCASASTRWW